jgi:molecular chaperone DnaK
MDMKLTRAKFDDLTAKLVERCRGPVQAAMADAKLTQKEIDEVILVGGSTRIPAVQKLVRELLGKEPHMGVNPDEVVAIGAAIQAGVLAGEVKDVVLLDVTPLSLGVETLGGVMTRVIERNTTIPVRRSQIFSTADDNQPAVDINVLQGEREMARDNRTLGQFKLDGIPPAPRGIPQVEVTFDIDANGILKVGAQDKASGKEQTVTISGSGNLDKGEIDRMVSDAQANAEKDKTHRQEIEIRNEADSLAYQVERQLKDLGDKVPVHEKARVEQLATDLKAALKENAPVDKIRSLKDDLQQAAFSLSEAAYKKTQPAEGAGTAGGGPGGNSGGTSGGDTKEQPGRPDVVDAEYEVK